MAHLLAYSGHIYSYSKPNYQLFGYLLSTEFSTSPDSFDLYWLATLYNASFDYRYQDTYYARNKQELYYLSNPKNLINISKSSLLDFIYIPNYIDPAKNEGTYNIKIYGKYDDILNVS